MASDSALNVTTSELQQLSAAQADSAQRIDIATDTTKGIGDDVWISHGVISAESNTAVQKAEAARNEAGLALKEAAASLAKKLGTAARSYELADVDAGDSLDNQMSRSAISSRSFDSDSLTGAASRSEVSAPAATPRVSGLAMRTAADEETAPTPEVPPSPMLGQLIDASAQAAELSGHASQHVGLVNETMGSVQQIVSMAQQGQPAAVEPDPSSVDTASTEPANHDGT